MAAIVISALQLVEALFVFDFDSFLSKKYICIECFMFDSIFFLSSLQLYIKFSGTW